MAAAVLTQLYCHLCGNQRVEKNRFVIPWEDGLKWEVDEFLG